MYQFQTEPFKHQLQAWERSKDKKSFAYLMEMGTGKTKVLIDVSAYLWEQGEIDGLVVVAPNGVHRQFINEQLPEHLPERIPTLTATFRSGAGVKLKRHLEKLLKKTKEHFRVVAVNVESLSHKSGSGYLERVLKSGRFLLAVDESSTIKTPSARRTKTLVRLSKFAKYRRILTGSPITRGVEDLFTQFRFLDPKIIGLKSFYVFRNRYCITAPIPGAPSARARRIVGYRNLGDLQEKIAPHSFRIKKDECLDLPDKIYMTSQVPMHPDQERLYRELKEQLLVELQDGTIMAAPLAVVRLMRLQQIVCGHVPRDPEDNDGRWTQVPYKGEVPRVVRARELSEESQGPVIIWARFRADLDLLQQALRPLGTVRYDGTVSDDDREQAIEDWRNGDAKVFLGQPAVGGLGLNLVGASTVIYYSNSFNAEHRWQSEDRAHRLGTVNRVTYVDLLSPGTLDSKIREALTKKEDIASMTLSGIRRILDE